MNITNGVEVWQQAVTQPVRELERVIEGTQELNNEKKNVHVDLRALTLLGNRSHGMSICFENLKTKNRILQRKSSFATRMLGFEAKKSKRVVFE